MSINIMLPKTHDITNERHSIISHFLQVKSIIPIAVTPLDDPL